ncbi:hypothetical protein H6P81_019941 [Aristolochia fimbriata]|uniref:Uncharacterized protein n=1 Tax=Aristolochia fimbriata TaxID=158543 RepID=A0AAV7DUC6_ARIFI|nr:hypothetical protein H6P81_019941 [Aristolochia fimbriata]
MSRNQIIVQAAKEYPQPLGVDACIRLFEQFKSYQGPYFFLGTYLSSRESKFYDPEKKKNFLMEAKLPDARPLINVCGCFGFVPDLTHCHANPGNAPLVVVQLLDDECPEDFINLSALSFQRILLWCNIYIAKATGIVSAYGFPVVVGERSYPLPCMPTTCFDILKDMAKM